MAKAELVEAVVLPDFRNFGVLLRIVLVAESCRVISAYAGSGNWDGAVQQIVSQGPYFEPVLLLVLLALFFLARRVESLSYRQGMAVVMGLAGLSAVVWRSVMSWAFPMDRIPGIGYVIVLAVALAWVVVNYFNLRHRTLSPALAESRLLALQARIRPHFLFNSLNAVLGLIREDPKRAEQILENLSDLFRALLAEAGTLVRLEQEIEHARAYAEIEAMRLGQRLTVNWQCQNAPPDALVPPLTLQPLLENAVYHGIEPLEEGGTVTVSIFLKGGLVNMVVRNPSRPKTESRPGSHVGNREGNRMALNNIRERLALHFDEEGELSAFEAGGEYVVQIRLPYKRAEGQPYSGPGGGAGSAAGRDQ